MVGGFVGEVLEAGLAVEGMVVGCDGEGLVDAADGGFGVEVGGKEVTAAGGEEEEGVEDFGGGEGDAVVDGGEERDGLGRGYGAALRDYPEQ